MVKNIKIKAKTRKEEKAKKLRSQNFIPAVIYGSKNKPRSLSVKQHDLEVAYSAAGRSHLIDFEIDGENIGKAIIKDVQMDPVKDKIIHIDFYQVDMDQKLDVEIALNFQGISKAVNELGGMLIKNIESINARCLPSDLIDRIDVDISKLNSYDDVIKVKDLNIPGNIEIFISEEDTVALVAEQKEEEILEEKPEASEEKEAGEAKEGGKVEEKGGDQAGKKPEAKK